MIDDMVVSAVQKRRKKTRKRRKKKRRRKKKKKEGLDAFALRPGVLFVCVCANSDGLVPDSSYILALLFECSQVSGHCDLLRKRNPKGQ